MKEGYLALAGYNQDLGDKYILWERTVVRGHSWHHCDLSRVEAGVTELLEMCLVSKICSWMKLDIIWLFLDLSMPWAFFLSIAFPTPSFQQQWAAFSSPACPCLALTGTDPSAQIALLHGIAWVSAMNIEDSAQMLLSLGLSWSPPPTQGILHGSPVLPKDAAHVSDTDLTACLYN